MKIADVRVREVSVPRIYDTYSADPRSLQSADDPGRSRYQIVELYADDGRVGLGEVSDIADRMCPLAAEELRDLLKEEVGGGDVEEWRALFARVAAALPEEYHPELRGLTLFGAEIALLDLVGKRFGVPLYELLGGRCRERVEVCWVGFLRGDIQLAAELAAFETEIGEKVAQGMRAFKLKVGEDHSRDLARVELFRKIAGPDLYLRVDASGSWEEQEAIFKIGELARAGVNACETPVVAVSRQVANDHPEEIEARADELVAMANAERGFDSYRPDGWDRGVAGQHGGDGTGDGSFCSFGRGGGKYHRILRFGESGIAGRRCVQVSVRIRGRYLETVCWPRARGGVRRGENGAMGVLGPGLYVDEAVSGLSL